MLVEMFNPIQSRFIVCPTVWRRFNDLGVKDIGTFVLRREVVLALDNKERRYYKTVVVYTFDRYRLFAIASLQLFASSATIKTYNDHCNTNDAYHKANLIEIVEVVVLDTIFRLYVFHQFEPPL